MTTFHFQHSAPGQSHWRIRWDRIGAIVAVNVFWAVILATLIVRKML